MCDRRNNCNCRRLKSRCYDCIRAKRIATDILTANNANVQSLTTTSNFIPPVYPNDPTPLPPAGSIWYNTTTMTLNYSNGTSVEVLETTDPQVDLIDRKNLTVTPNATLELIDNSIPDDFPDSEDPTMTLFIPPCPIGRSKTFILLSIGTADTSSNVFLTGDGISATLSPTGVVGVQSATFVYGGAKSGWINISASTPVPPVPSFGYPQEPSPLSLGEKGTSSSPLSLGEKGTSSSPLSLGEKGTSSSLLSLGEKGTSSSLLGKGKKNKGSLGQLRPVANQNGYSVCLTPDGNWLFVGAPYYGFIGTNLGQVSILKLNDAGVYVDAGKLIPSEGGNILFGSSIGTSVDGYVCIGGPGYDNNLGAVWVYQYDADSDSWKLLYKLTPPSQAGLGCRAGYSCTVSMGTWSYGDNDPVTTIYTIVGAPFASGTGGVFVYQDGTYLDTSFNQLPSNGSLFGYSVGAISNSLENQYPSNDGSFSSLQGLDNVDRGIYYFVGAPKYQGVWIMAAYRQVRINRTTQQPVDAKFLSNQNGFIPAPPPTSLSLSPLSLSLSPLDKGDKDKGKDKGEKDKGKEKGGELKSFDQFLRENGSKPKPKVVRTLGIAPSVAGDTTANFGGIAFDSDRYVHTVYQLPTGIDVGPTQIFTSKTLNKVENPTIGTNPPVLVATTNLSAYWPIQAQPRNTISASPKIASDLTNNILYIVYTDAASNDSDLGALNMSINVSKSTDGGATWTSLSPPRPLGTNSAFLSNIAVDSTTGNVAVVWLDCAASGLANDAYQAVAVISNDQGNTWGPLITLSPGLSNNARHDDGYECGDYISLDFYNNSLAVVWPDNSNTPQIPNPNPEDNLEMVIGFALVSVSGNQGTVTTVTCASGNNLGPHFDCSVSINRKQAQTIAVSASQATETQQIYLATSVNSGGSWSGYNAFDGSVTGLKKALYGNNMVSSTDGVLFISYLADDQVSTILASSSSFGTTNDFTLVKDFTSTPTRIIDLPFLAIATLTIPPPPNPPGIPLVLQFLGVCWQDISQGYTFSYGSYTPPTLSTPAGYLWSGLTKCDTPVDSVSTYYELHSQGSESVMIYSQAHTQGNGNQIKLKAPPVLNSIQDFGSSLACNANTLVVGAPSSTFTIDGNNVVVGVAVVYTGSKTNWNKFGPFLYGTDYVNSPLQGSSVAISGDGQTILIGGPNDGVNQGTGASWVFTRSDNNYVVQGAGIRNANLIGNARQGYSSAVNGNGTVKIIGAPLNNNNAGTFFYYPALVPTPPATTLTSKGKKKNS